MDPGSTMATGRTRTAIPFVARYTWSRQWRAELFIGLCGGIFGLAAFAAKRSLGAPEWVVPLIAVAGQLPWILAPAWEPIFARADPQRAFLWLGFLSKGPLLLVAFVHVAEGGGGSRADLVLFIVAVVLFYVVDGAYIPHRGALLRANFPLRVRGRMFGLLSTVALVASMVGSKGGGILLDGDPRWLRLLFPVAAVSGILGHVLLSRIRWRRDGAAVPDDGLRRSPVAALLHAWREALGVLRKDRPFLLYEVGFMTYGFGLLMSSPLIVLYAESELGLSYDQWTWAQGVASPLAHLLSIGAIGRLSDRLGLVRTTSLAYLLLIVFFALLPLVSSPAGLVGAHALLGVAMAGVSIGWSLGPLRFAPEGRARVYTSVHVLLVGVRSGLAPLIGYAVARLTSLEAAFLVSASLMTVACLIMTRLANRHR